VSMWQAPPYLVPELPTDKRNNDPPTEWKTSALRSLGLDGAAFSGDQQDLILAARDYAHCIIGKSAIPGWHYKEARLTLISFVLEAADPAWLVRWSSSQWARGGDDDPKRVPANDLRKAVKAHFQQMVTEGPGR
jgi:hypothetical protein